MSIWMLLVEFQYNWLWIIFSNNIIVCVCCYIQHKTYHIMFKLLYIDLKYTFFHTCLIPPGADPAKKPWKTLLFIIWSFMLILMFHYAKDSEYDCRLAHTRMHLTPVPPIGQELTEMRFLSNRELLPRN